jgi:hypothetical protein
MNPPHPPDRARRSLFRWPNLLTLMRSPVALIVAVGALWTSVMAADGAPAMSPIACWLWLTVLFITRRAVKRKRVMTRSR